MGTFPVILERTPYDKGNTSRSEISRRHAERPQSRADVAAFFVQHGYVMIYQDCRGRYGSEGVFRKYLDEATDGYDTCAWIVQQPWCNGTIGTMGLSYAAHTHMALASLSPPGLAAMFVDSGGFSNAYHSGIRQGGAFELKQATWAYNNALKSPAVLADPQRHAVLAAVDLPQWFAYIPWQPGHSPVTAAPEYGSIAVRWVSHHQGGAMAPYVHATTSICRVLLSLAGMFGLTLLADRGSCASDSDTARATLRGWPGVFVAVEALAPAVERTGLTTRQLHTDVELQLQQAGLRLLIV